MSFLSRRKAELTEQGVDSSRIPPGQYVTDRFPVLHAGVTPKVRLATWDFRVEGLVEELATFSYEDIVAMPQSERTFDIHCVTKWTKLDTVWRGVSVTELMSRLRPSPGASHVLVLAEQGFTANVPMADFLRPDNLFAPVSRDYGAHGRFDARARSSSAEWWMLKHRSTALVGMLAVAATAAIGATAAAALWHHARRV